MFRPCPYPTLKKCKLFIMFKYLLFFKILIFMITIHTVKHTKIQERINKHGTKRKNNISLISFFTIFNNIKERRKKTKTARNIGLI